VNPRWEDTPRGRPCPAIVDGLRCCGSSEVLNVRHFDERTVRYRRCVTCGHRWRTSEREDEAPASRVDVIFANDTGSNAFLDAPPYTRPKRSRSSHDADFSTPLLF
jgi:Zn ribbon nucleic-acid-binding protein